MVFQLDFKGPYHNIRIYLGNTLVICDLYRLFLYSGHCLSYFWLKKPTVRSLCVILVL